MVFGSVVVVAIAKREWIYLWEGEKEIATGGTGRESDDSKKKMKLRSQYYNPFPPPSVVAAGCTELVHSLPAVCMIHVKLGPIRARAMLSCRWNFFRAHQSSSVFKTIIRSVELNYSSLIFVSSALPGEAVKAHV